MRTPSDSSRTPGFLGSSFVPDRRDRRRGHRAAGRAARGTRTTPGTCTAAGVPGPHAAGLGGPEPVQYPDPDIVALDPASAATSSATRSSGGSTSARCGPKARPGTASAAIWCGATSRTTCRCAGSKKTGASRVFRNPSGYSNGNTFDYEGRQLSCEHGGRRVVRYEPQRHGDGHRRQVSGQALELAQRRRRASRRRHLVHRSLLRHPRQLRRLQGRAGD